jgi:lysophospholipase L1-like esterase
VPNRLWSILAGGGALALLGLGVWAVSGSGHAAPPPTPTPSPTALTAPPTLPPASTAETPVITATPQEAAPASPSLHFALLPQPFTYVALGASDTVGMGATHPDTENWAAQLAAKLPPGTHFQRFARNGITLGEALTALVPDALAAKPDLITVWLVINDGLHGVQPAAYRANLRLLLARLTEQTHATIVLLNAPDISLILPAQATPGTRVAVQTLTQQWNQLIAQEAAAYPGRVLLVDLYTPSQGARGRPDWVSGDRFHPSTAGYTALADVVYQAMQTAGLVR